MDVCDAPRWLLHPWLPLGLLLVPPPPALLSATCLPKGVLLSSSCTLQECFCGWASYLTPNLCLESFLYQPKELLLDLLLEG